MQSYTREQSNSLVQGAQSIAEYAESQSGARAPKHKYSLADYGLTVDAVKERFAGL